MRALVITKPRYAEVREVPRPVLRPSEILVRVRACGICGTDVHIYRGEYLAAYPVVPGHEFAGEVVEVGQLVTRFKPGGRVAVEPNLNCGRCRYCIRGESNFCERWQAIGVTLPGGMAEFVAVPESAAFNIADIPFSAAAFMEPLSCVLHGISKLNLKFGERVLIVGAGPIGLMLAQCAQNSGVAVVVADRVEPRLEFAEKLLACETASTAGGFGDVEKMAGGGYDAVIDATGVPDVMEKLIGFTWRGGRILLFGVAPKNATMRLDPFEMFRKELCIISSYTSVRNSEQALALIQSGRIRVTELISHTLTLDEFARAVELLKSSAHVMKIQLLP